MGVISLAEVEIIERSRIIPLLYSAWTDQGTTIAEPWFDYDDDGEPQDFGIDMEPPDPSLEDISGVDPSTLVYNVSPSEFTETAIRIPEPGRVSPFTFVGREYLRRIYDTPAQRLLLKCGRQIEKSTTLGNKLLGYACLNNNFKCLFVAPSAEQAKVFSNDRVKDIIDNSPLLNVYTNTKLNQNVFFKKLINFSQIRLRYAYLTADRCITGDSRVDVADGTYPTIKQLVEQGTEVDVVTRNIRGALCVSRGCRPRLIGYEPVVKITTTFPLPLRCTLDHKVETARGLIPANELRTGDFLLAPHTGSQHTYRQLSPNYCWIIGAMVAEGSSVKPGDVKFTNTDLEFVLEFRERCQRAGITLGSIVPDRRYARTCYSVSLYSDTRGQGLHGAKAILWELGEFGKGATEKHIPSCIFRAQLKGKAAFLRALFRGDGWCCPEHGYARAGYSTASRQLAEDLVYLLWSLGIRVALRQRPPSTKGAKGSWALDFSTGDTHKLVALIGAYRTGLTYRARPSKNDKDRIPLSYAQLREHLKAKHGLTTHTAWSRHKIQLRPGNRKDSVGRRVLLSIARKLDDPFLLNLCRPDTSWVEVKSITRSRKKEAVYCISVPETERFIANGLVIQNCRGIPADMIEIDELQDILVDNIPVIEQCAFHSPYKLFVYSGTPKSMDNTIEHYWTNFSTQNEWIVPCERHGTPKDPSSWHWNILTEANIGKKGLVCDRCGEPISASHPLAKWAAMNPPMEDNKDRVTFEGYRIPQIMVPWVDWGEVLQHQEQYSRAQFHNEKLGLSYDSGVRPLSRGQLKRCCRPEIRLGDVEHFKRLTQGNDVYAGIDWGSGEQTYTVLSLGGYFGTGNFSIFWAHRFTGPDLDPEVQLDKICQLITQLNVRLVGADYGGGFHQNAHLIRNFGPQRVMKYQYNPKQKKKIYWEPTLGRFMCHRTEVMSDFFGAIKRKLIDLPCWEDFREPFGQDCLNIFSEYNERLRMTEFKKKPGTTDDTFHSMLLCFFVSMLHHPRPDITARQKDTGLPRGIG